MSVAEQIHNERFIFPTLLKQQIKNLKLYIQLSSLLQTLFSSQCLNIAYENNIFIINYFSRKCGILRYLPQNTNYCIKDILNPHILRSELCLLTGNTHTVIFVISSVLGEMYM